MYIVDDQEDLTVTFNFYEDLTDYTGKIRYYHISDSVTDASSKTATISSATTLSTVSYSVEADGPIFTDNGEWVVWAVIESSTGKMRACEPYIVEVRDGGIP